MTKSANSLFLPGYAAAVIITMVFFAACGKKAPPVPPQAVPLPAVSNLEAKVEGQGVALRWQVDDAGEGLKGYVVYRATVDLSTEDCPGCPMIFQKIARVPAEGQNGPLMYFEQVPKGFRYTYKVRPFFASGNEGPDSNKAVAEIPE